jgi:hypothetical protein
VYCFICKAFYIKVWGLEHKIVIDLVWSLRPHQSISSVPSGYLHLHLDPWALFRYYYRKHNRKASRIAVWPEAALLPQPVESSIVAQLWRRFPSQRMGRSFLSLWRGLRVDAWAADTGDSIESVGYVHLISPPQPLCQSGHHHCEWRRVNVNQIIGVGVHFKNKKWSVSMRCCFFLFLSLQFQIVSSQFDSI